MIMQLLYDLSLMRPSSIWGREVRRVAIKVRAVLSRCYDPIVKATIRGLPLYVHASNVNPISYAEDFYDDQPIPRIVRFVSERKAGKLGLIDIGANVGFTALIAHSVAPESDFLLIEGDPLSFELLERNTQTIRNRRLEKVILGESDEQVVGEFLQSGAGTASFVEYGTVAVEGGGKTFIPQRVQHRKATLDSIARNMARVDYIKIDTDGAEPKILLGGKETLTNHKPVVFCEFNPLGTVYKAFDADPMRIFALFQECGFEKYCFYDQGGKMILSADFGREAHVFRGLTNYCMSAIGVMDVAVFHRESNDFEQFLQSETAYYQQVVDRFVAFRQWKRR